jgi:hypothetical protein
VIEAIGQVVEARLGPVPPGEEFELEVRRKNGGEVDPADLPKSRDWVLGTAEALLSENSAAGRERLAAAGRHPDPLRRATLLADELIWLDFLLDVDAPDPPDMAV